MRDQTSQPGQTGGLIRSMPWIAAVALIGTLAIAGLPPLGGFASEWMLFRPSCSPTLPNSYLNMLVPVATAALALAVSGRPRHGEVLRHHFWAAARKSWLKPMMRTMGASRPAMVGVVRSAGVSACPGCRAMDPIAHAGGRHARGSMQQSGWLFPHRNRTRTGGYSPLLFLIGIIITGLVIYRWCGASIAGVRRSAPGLRLCG